MCEDCTKADNNTSITLGKPCPCNEHPFTSHFYIPSKTGVYTGKPFFFLIFALRHRSWVLVRTVSMRRFRTCTLDICFRAKIVKKQNSNTFFILKLPFLQLWNIAVYCMDDVRVMPIGSHRWTVSNNLFDLTIISIRCLCRILPR